MHTRERVCTVKTNTTQPSNTRRRVLLNQHARTQRASSCSVHTYSTHEAHSYRCVYSSNAKTIRDPLWKGQSIAVDSNAPHTKGRNGPRVAFLPLLPQRAVVQSRNSRKEELAPSFSAFSEFFPRSRFLLLVVPFLCLARSSLTAGLGRGFFLQW